MSHDYYETNFTENCYFEIVKGVINTSLRTTDTTQALLNKHRHFSTSECIHSKFHVKLNFVKDPFSEKNWSSFLWTVRWPVLSSFT